MSHGKERATAAPPRICHGSFSPLLPGSLAMGCRLSIKPRKSSPGHAPRGYVLPIGFFFTLFCRTEESADRLELGNEDLDASARPTSVLRRAIGKMSVHVSSSDNAEVDMDRGSSGVSDLLGVRLGRRGKPHLFGTVSSDVKSFCLAWHRIVICSDPAGQA